MGLSFGKRLKTGRHTIGRKPKGGLLGRGFQARRRKMGARFKGYRKPPR